MSFRIFRRFISQIPRNSKMADKILDSVESVIIDEGVFKYVLIKVSSTDQADESQPFKKVVRGHLDCEWHSDVFDRFKADCDKKGLQADCLGGGRIEHRPSEKFIKVYGYSQGFGKADHSESKEILLAKYRGYTIETSDDGY